jgi:hypothetical protein
MGFYPQPNPWICGPFALKHALAVWGRFVPEWDLARVAGSDASGTDEQELGRAAASVGFDLGMERIHDVANAHALLVEHLSLNIPTLLCIEQWDHWVTVVAEEDGNFVLFDSRFPSVVRVLSREVLLAKWRYHDPDEAETDLYDLHPLTPRLPTRVAAHFSLSRARELMRFENLELTRRWAELASYLVDLGATSGAGDPDLFTARVADGLRSWHERRSSELQLPANGVTKAVDYLTFVAETYDFVFRVEDAARIETQLSDAVRRTMRVRDIAALDPALSAEP